MRTILTSTVCINDIRARCALPFHSRCRIHFHTFSFISILNILMRRNAFSFEYEISLENPGQRLFAFGTQIRGIYSVAATSSFSVDASDYRIWPRTNRCVHYHFLSVQHVPWVVSCVLIAVSRPKQYAKMCIFGSAHAVRSVYMWHRQNRCSLAPLLFVYPNFQKGIESWSLWIFSSMVRQVILFLPKRLLSIELRIT